MHVNTRVLVEPRLYYRVFMGRIVVGNQMQSLVLGRLPINFLQELQPFHMGMALLTLSDDLTIQHVECGKQGRSAITFVVVGHRLCAALFEGESRLGPVQGLYLTFFIHAEHQGMFRGRHI